MSGKRARYQMNVSCALFWLPSLRLVLSPSSLLGRFLISVGAPSIAYVHCLASGILSSEMSLPLIQKIEKKIERYRQQQNQAKITGC